MRLDRLFRNPIPALAYFIALGWWCMVHPGVNLSRLIVDRVTLPAGGVMIPRSLDSALLIATVLVALVALFVMNALIVALAAVVAPFLYALIRRAQHLLGLGNGKPKGVAKSSSTLRRIWNTLGGRGKAGKGTDYELVVTYHEGVLAELSPGLHNWFSEQRTAASVAAGLFTSFLLACLTVWLCPAFPAATPETVSKAGEDLLLFGWWLPVLFLMLFSLFWGYARVHGSELVLQLISYINITARLGQFRAAASAADLGRLFPEGGDLRPAGEEDEEDEEEDDEPFSSPRSAQASDQ